LYLLYLDESGTPDGWQDQKHFVLGGAAIHEGQVYSLSKHFDNVQARFFPGMNLPLAFHATDIRAGKQIFRDLRRDTREQLLSELYQCISTIRFPGLILFATAMHVTMARNPEQVLRQTFQDVCLRFNKFLERQYKSHHPTKGMLIIDQAHAQNFRRLIQDFQTNGTEYGYLGNIVDIPYFARRHDTRMIQLADFCANAVFRYYEKNDSRYFEQILPRFDRRTDKCIDGLKHLTKEDCQCEACHWRKEVSDDTEYSWTYRDNDI